MKLKWKKFFNFPVLAVLAGAGYLLCFQLFWAEAGEASAESGKTVVHYWEKWSGFELAPMQEIVDEFNASQDRIEVKITSVGDMEQKLMLAIAGGNPPDLAGLWSHSINVFADKGALTPLDHLMRRHELNLDSYLPVVQEFCRRHGFVWALPTTPASLALHWNKALFRQAGLDPKRPPRSLEELDRMAEQLTSVELSRDGKRVTLPYSELTPAEKDARDFRILCLGYAPNIPGWYDALWSFWQGGALCGENGEITAETPENLAALRWYRSFAQKYGRENLQRFTAGGGTFASPQNPFLAGKVAMVLQGVWMYNFIDKFAPSLEWGASPFPAAPPLEKVTLVESDVIVIPRGANHPREAFEFLAYLQQPENLEKLNLGQRKFSPLRQLSPDFVRRHPNPYIGVFIELAASPNARSVPASPLWNEYKSELLVAYEQVFSDSRTPEAALAEVQQRIGWKYSRTRQRWELVKEERLREWSSENDRF